MDRAGFSPGEMHGRPGSNTSHAIEGFRRARRIAATGVVDEATAASRIGKTQSHGCLRLTNWDAMRLAALVGRGARVVLQ